jgi:hypothetical protein
VKNARSRTQVPNASVKSHNIEIELARNFAARAQARIGTATVPLCFPFTRATWKELLMRVKLFTAISSVAALVAGTMVVAAQTQPQPGGAPPSAPPQGLEQPAGPRAQQPAAPRGSVGQGTREELITPREQQEKLPLQPGGKPANEAPQGKGADN